MRGFVKMQKDLEATLTAEQVELRNAALAAQKDFQLKIQTASWTNPLGGDITQEQANAAIDAWNEVSPGGLQLNNV
jgi:hypothetical protein